jgi:hypothetical protein
VRRLDQRERQCCEREEHHYIAPQFLEQHFRQAL